MEGFVARRKLSFVLVVLVRNSFETTPPPQLARDSSPIELFLDLCFEFEEIKLVAYYGRRNLKKKFVHLALFGREKPFSLGL